MFAEIVQGIKDIISIIRNYRVGKLNRSILREQLKLDIVTANVGVLQAKANIERAKTERKKVA